jgi:FAD synthase
MVTKIRNKRGLYLLEATMEGVATYTLSSALQVYRETSTIGVRRLKMDRNRVILNALMDFVDEVHGRPFKTNLLEFIRAAYSSNQQEDNNSLFCSQLIAKAYKEMGMLIIKLDADHQTRC